MKASDIVRLRCSLLSRIPACAGMTAGQSLCALALLLATAEPSHAADIRITAAGAPVERSVHQLNATAVIDLPENVQAALDKGVDLFFAADVKIVTPRKWRVDRPMVNLTIVRRLGFHALTRKYVVDDTTLGRGTGKKSDKRKSFTSLKAALSYLGRYRNIPLVNEAVITPSPQTKVRMRVRLMGQKLSLPLRLKRVYSKAWRLSSGWYEWSLE